MRWIFPRAGNRKAEALVFHARHSAFAAAFVYAMVAFRNGKILHIDEIKQWVPSVQYMFAHNTLPYGPDLIGQASTLPSPAPFHYFFVQLTGFVEGTSLFRISC